MTQWLKDDENSVPISFSSEGLAVLDLNTENGLHHVPPYSNHVKLKLDFFPHA